MRHASKLDLDESLCRNSSAHENRTRIAIRASGGGSKSPLWRQIQADVFGQKVVTINAEQGPAFGVALLAAVGAGAYKNIEEACAATIKVVSETPLDKKAKRTYDAGFPVYQQLYRSLKNDFKSISGLE